MRRALLFLAPVVVVAAAIGATWAAAAGGALTGPATRWISGQLGRELAVDGGLRIRVGRITRVTATGLRLANAPWGARPDMLRARSVTIDVDTRSLLDDTVIVTDARIEGADLLLERTTAGEQNWDLALPPRERPPGAALPVVVERLALPGARIRFTGPRFARPVDIALESVTQAMRADGMLELAARGSANDTPLDLRVQGGPLAGLVAGRDIRFSITGSVGDVELEGDGRIDSLAAPVDTAIGLRVQGPDAGYLAERLGVRNIGSGPFALDGLVEPAPGGAGLRGRVSGRLGGFDGVARGYLDPRAQPAVVAVQARVAGPDLSLAGGLAGIDRLPAEPFRLRLDVLRRDQALRIRDSELVLADARATFDGALDAAKPGEGTLDFRAEGTDLAAVAARLGVAGLPVGPFSAQGSASASADGRVALDASATTPLGQLAAAGSLGPAPQFHGTQLRVTASGPDFAPVARLFRWRDAPRGRFRARGNVAWGAAGLGLEGVTLAIGAEELKLDGNVGIPVRSPATSLRIAATGPDAARTGAQLGIEGLPAVPFRMTGRLRRQAAAALLDDVTATLAGATLRLNGTVGDAPTFAGTRVAFDAAGPALERFGTLAPGVELPRGAFKGAGVLERTATLITLRDVRASVAGAEGTVSAGFTLPVATGAATFDVDARGADLAALVPGLSAGEAGRNFELQAQGSRTPGGWNFERLRLRTDSGFVSLAGNLELSPRFETTALVVEGRASSLRNVGRLLGREWPDEPLELSARLRGTGADFDLQELDGTVGASDFSGRVAVRTRGDTRDFDAAVQSRLLDLRPYLPGPVSGRPASAAPKKARRGDKGLLIPARPLSLAALDGYTGRVALEAGEVRMPAASYRDLRVRGAAAPRRLQIESLSFGGADGEVSLRLRLEEVSGGVSAQVSGTGTNLALAPIPTGPRGANASRFEARYDLRGTGRDTRELAASLWGSLQLVGHGGRIANARLAAATDDFLSQLLTSLNPMTTRQPATDVVCVAYLLEARDGVVTTKPALVMRTTELDIISHGTLDLRTEKIDFSFKTGARKGLGLGVAQLVNPYVKVTGTLAAPGLALDPRGAVVNGGAAFATAGLSILATTAWDRVFRAKDPCGAAVAEARGDGPTP